VAFRDEQLAMARSWRRVHEKDLSGYLAVIGRLRQEVHLLTVYDRVWDFLLPALFTLLGFLCGYVYRPIVERYARPDGVEAAQPELPPTRPTPPAPPRGREGHR
jgi:hypothetical protein